MGKILQIRVTAWTYDTDEVTRAWPLLTGLVWPEASKWSPPGGKHGVLELAKALPDVARFGDWPEKTRQALKAGILQVFELAEKIETALANWQPGLANGLSDELEDALSALEKTVPTDEDDEAQAFH